MISDRGEPVLRLADGVIYRAIDEQEGALLDLDQRRFYSVNPSALFILDELRRGRTRGEILAAMCEQFETDERQCAVDLDRFLEELREGGLLLET